MMLGLADAVRQHTTFSFSRAGGPGGQHVNKVQTKVRARLRLNDLTIITDHQKDLARRNLGRRVTAGGEIVVVVDQERSQARNREIALDRLGELLDTAVQEPRVRIRTRTPRRAHERRLAGKRRQSLTKRLRGRVARDD